MILRATTVLLLLIFSLQSSAQLSCKNIFEFKVSQANDKVLRIMSYNVLNLYLHMGKYEWQESGLQRSSRNKLPPEKDREQTQGIADVIIELKPDFLLLQEVEGVESIRRFVSEYLNDEYQIYMPKTNDERGIGSVLLVKNSLEVEIIFESNNEHRWKDHANNNRVTPLFSRNFPVFKVFKKGSHKPSLIIAGVHFKSRRDRRNDPKSFFKRSAEIQKATDILNEVILENENTPLIVMGDFNSARGQKEVEVLRNGLKLFDAHLSKDHFYDPLKSPDVTHSYHPIGEATVLGALDMALLSAVLRENLIRSSIYRYKDKDGNLKSIPDSREERDQNPSDHFPIYIDLSQKLLAQ